MIKDAAPGAAKDPAQNKIRQHKAVWNKEISGNLADLYNLKKNIVQFKKMMNGWPSIFNNDKLKITEPMPENTASILEALTQQYLQFAEDFRDLAHDGAAIISEQKQYSDSRNKQLSLFPKAEIYYELISEGSNPFSRLFSKFKGPFFGESDERKINVHRKDALDIAAELHQSIKQFRKSIVGYGKESIEDSEMYLEQAFSEYEELISEKESVKKEFPKLFTDLRAMEDISLEQSAITPQPTTSTNQKPTQSVTQPVQPTTQTSGQTTSQPTEEFTEKDYKEVEELIKDYDESRKLISPELEKKLNSFPEIVAARIALKNAVSVYKMSKIKDKPAVVKTIIEAYAAYVGALNGLAVVKPSEMPETIDDALINFNRTAAEFRETLNKQAQLGRWTGKALHKIKGWGSRNSRRRVKIYDKTQALLSLTNRLMESFEKAYRPYEFEKILESIRIGLKDIREDFVMLKSSFNLKKYKPSTTKTNDFLPFGKIDREVRNHLSKDFPRIRRKR